jgi:hypothetical protein
LLKQLVKGRAYNAEFALPTVSVRDQVLQYLTIEKCRTRRTLSRRGRWNSRSASSPSHGTAVAGWAGAICSAVTGWQRNRVVLGSHLNAASR